jgi:hypothetical protein
MIKIKKVSSKTLTNEEVIAYDEHGDTDMGTMFTPDRQDLGVVCGSLTNVKYYFKLSDIDKEAHKQIKELKKV